MKKFSIIMTYYIPLKRSWKILFNDYIFENINSNYYHQKPETWHITMKKFPTAITHHIPLKMSWKMLFKENIFWNVDSNSYHKKSETWYSSDLSVGQETQMLRWKNSSGYSRFVSSENKPSLRVEICLAKLFNHVLVDFISAIAPHRLTSFLYHCFDK